jgi:protein KRI1
MKLDGEESEESEEEDETGQEMTPDVDAQILRTIAAIRCKSKEVLESDKNFFSGTLIHVMLDMDCGWSCMVVLEEELRPLQKSAAQALGTSDAQTAPSRPVTIKDYHRNLIMRGEIPGALVESNEMSMSHAQEQEELKREIVV